MFVKGNHDVRNEVAGGGHTPKVQADEKSQAGLNPQFDERTDSAAILMRDLGVIVVKAESCKHDHR